MGKSGEKEGLAVSIGQRLGITTDRDRLERQVESLEADRDLHRSNAQELQRRVTELASSRDLHYSSATTLAREVERLKRELAELQARPSAAPAQIEALKDGLRAARVKLVEQQSKLAGLSIQLEDIGKEPYTLGTVLNVKRKQWRPEPGTVAKVLHGEHAGKLVQIGEVTSKGVLCSLEPAAAMKQTKASSNDPNAALVALLERVARMNEPPTSLLQFTWKRHWNEVLGPTDGETTVFLATVSMGSGQRTDVIAPPDLHVQAGDTVRLHQKTFQIIGKQHAPSVGELATVSSVLADGVIEVEHRGDAKAVLAGRFAKGVKAGDRVQLDESGSIVTTVYAANASGGRFVSAAATNVDWDAVGGQHEAKRALIEAIVDPHVHAELFAHYGKAPTKGVLLQGPPGCGKTTLAKAVATAVARRNGCNVTGGFIYLSGTEIMNQWLGNSEAAIRQIFSQARAFKAQHGFPAVVCIDECESVMRKRGESGGRDFLDTFVPTFLTEMDGLEGSGAIVILLTNRADVLDPAIIRDGRIDHIIDVRRPNEEETREIFAIHLRQLPLAEGEDIGTMAAKATVSLFSDCHVLTAYPLMNGSTAPFTLKGLRSGALVEGIVEAAKKAAIRRDIASGKRSGISASDILEAIRVKAHEKKSVEHRDAALEFFAEFPLGAGTQDGGPDGPVIPMIGTTNGPHGAN